MPLTQQQIQENINAMGQQGATQDDIKGYIDSLGNTQSPTPPKNQSQPKSVLGNFALGAGKEIMALPFQVGGALQSIGRGVGQGLKNSGIPGVSQFGGAMVNSQQNTPSIQTPQVLQPQGIEQEIGKGTTDIAELLFPTGIEQGVTDVFKSLPKISEDAPLLAKVVSKGIPILGKSLASGAEFGGKTFLQTGGDTNKSIKSGVIASTIEGSLGTVGGILKSTGVPEILYSKVFKTSTDDLLNQLKNTVFSDLKKSNPELYKSYIEQGVIRVENGVPKLDETMAKQALDRGLKGSITGMAKETIRQTLKSEATVKSIVSGIKDPIDLPYPQLTGVLENVAKSYKNVGQGEVAATAQGFVDALKTGEGKVNAETLLNMRRFMDGLRRDSSYGQPIENLAMTAKNFKYWSDTLRGKLNNLPGMAAAMKDYSFYINALDDLTSAAKKAGNKDAIGLMDTLYSGFGFVSGNPAEGLALPLARRILSAPSVLTGAGQAIEKGGSGVIPRILKSGSSYVGRQF